MPWSGDHADDELDDEAPRRAAGPSRAPLPPDDRLWRHPSELSGPAPVGALAARATAAAAHRAPRIWTVALASGLSGAAVALVVVGLVGGFGPDVKERVVERVPMTDAVVDAAAILGGGREGTDVVDVVDVAAAVSPSIVRIEGANPGLNATGSGVVIRDDGTILTNAHVVSGGERVMIILADGTGLPGHVLGSDTTTDVAVVAVDETHRDAHQWVPAILGSAADLRVGEPAVAVGSPLGLDGGPSVTVGVVSGLGRRVVAEGLVLHDMIQTDAPIAQGSSGGALCDATGAVVGLTTAVATSDTGSDGLGFAIPIDAASDVADRLLTDGAVRWVWLGIEGSDLAPTEVSMPGLAETGGVRVDRATVGGPADLAGVNAGDVVVALDGTRIATMSDLVVALRRYVPGDVVELRIRRGGDDLTIPVTLAEKPG